MEVRTSVLVEDGDEIESLAMELSRAYQQMAAFYRDKLELTGPEADQQARGYSNSLQEAAEDRARIVARPPDEVSWYELNHLADRDPNEAVLVWRRLKKAACEELASGHRAAHALEWQARPWDRARFLAIRQSFQSSHPPQNGIESALLDTAAEAYSDHLEWSEHLHMQVNCEVETERDALERHGGWSPPRLGMSEAIEQSSRMAERAHTRFLKTVKMLHELQRSTPTLYVANAGQVNVGQQQVNVADSPLSTTKEREDLPK